MPFASGNKKSTSVVDSRVAAADNAIVLQNGGFLFAPAADLPNDSLSSAATKPNWTVISIVAGVVVVALVFMVNRKT